MTLALVQKGDSAGFIAFDTPANVLPANVTVGNCVAVFVTTNGPPDNATVISSIGTFVRASGSAQLPGGAEGEWWVCYQATTAARSITSGGANFSGWAAAAFEFSGGVGSNVAAGSNSGTSSTVSQTTFGNDIVAIASLAAAAETSGPGTGWSDYNAGYFTQASGRDIAYAITATPPASVTWGLASSAAWITVGLSLQPAIGAFVMQTPYTSSFQDVSGGQAFSSLYEGLPNLVGDNASGYAFRIKVSGGSYSYWNAGTNALQSTIIYNAQGVLPNATFGPTLPAGVLSDGNVYNWAMAPQDALSGVQGGFSSDFTFTAEASPTLVITAPVGNTGGTDQPTVTWLAGLPSGASQVTYQIIVESGTFGSTPGAGTQEWSSGVVTSASTSRLVAVPLTPGTNQRVFVQISATGGLLSPWAFSSFVMTHGAPATPGITVTPTTDVNGCPIMEIVVQGFDNYMTANDSSFEGGGSGSVGSWTAGANSAATASNTVADDGTWSLRLARSTTSGTVLASSGKYAVQQGIEYTFMAAMRAASAGVARSCTFTASWYNGATLLSTSTIQTANDSTTAWVPLIGSAFAPAGANEVLLTMSIAAVASTTEFHYLDCAGIFPFGATSWAVGGFVGLTSTIITRSDNLYVRYASLLNPLPIPAVGQAATVFDYEAVPSVAYTYSAVVSVPSVPVTGEAAVSASETINAVSGWWELNPTAGTPTSNPSAVNAQMVGWSPVQTEQSTANPVINQPVMNIAANTMMQQDFSATAEVFSATIYAALNALLVGQETIFISSPWGALDSGYFRIGPESGGQSGGSGTTAKTTTLMASTAGAPHRTVAITAVHQARPPV